MPYNGDALQPSHTTPSCFIPVCVCVCVCMRDGMFDPIISPKYSNLLVISNLLVVVNNLSLFINHLFVGGKHAFSVSTHLHGGGAPP